MDNKKPVALVLEDEPLIALDLEMTLQSAGFEVVTLMSCEAAEIWIGDHRPEIAVVDVELRDGFSHTIAGLLHHLGVPFLVHSGGHPSQYVGTPFENGAWLNKPSASADLIKAVKQAVGTATECPTSATGIRQ